MFRSAFLKQLKTMENQATEAIKAISELEDRIEAWVQSYRFLHGVTLGDKLITWSESQCKQFGRNDAKLAKRFGLPLDRLIAERMLEAYERFQTTSDALSVEAILIGYKAETTPAEFTRAFWHYIRNRRFLAWNDASYAEATCLCRFWPKFTGQPIDLSDRDVIAYFARFVDSGIHAGAGSGRNPQLPEIQNIRDAALIYLEAIGYDTEELQYRFKHTIVTIPELAHLRGWITRQ